MPRRREVAKREILPDPKYNSKMIGKFIAMLMYQGKKSTAEIIFYETMNIIQSKTKSDPLNVFKQAMSNVKPALEVKSRRVGGSTYQVPVEVRPERRNTLAIRWLILYARQRKGLPMEQRLAAEVLDASQNKGSAVKKKEDTHRMAEANKAFAHYRW
ncbi:MAG: 30S ribosomal protein S7 [Candidatus Schekmanbacteria bacterium]|nr:30S ribosomal protein S7 [Candidatus Schekmanbacteria bacterium]